MPKSQASEFKHVCVWVFGCVRVCIVVRFGQCVLMKALNINITSDRFALHMKLTFGFQLAAELLPFPNCFRYLQYIFIYVYIHVHVCVH